MPKDLQSIRPPQVENNHLSYFFRSLQLILFLSGSLAMHATSSKNDLKADSIMRKVFDHTEIYGNYIQEYHSEAYIKGFYEVIKKNRLYRFAPDFLYIDNRHDSTLIETLVDVHFTAPNHFKQEIRAINGTNINAGELLERAMTFININVYNPTSFNDEVLMPISQSAFKYYRFEYVSSQDSLDNLLIHKIKVSPLIKSQKLISGHLYIVDGLWTLLQLDVNGKWEFSRFRVNTWFGLPDKDFLLPVKTDVTFRMNLLGNEVENHYTSRFEYKSIKRYSKNEERKKFNYDLSEYFNVRLDSLPVIKDSLFWEESRPIPLSEKEKKMYETDVIKWEKTAVDSLTIDKKRSWNFTKGIITPKRFEYNATQFRYSGLLNPFKLAYSKLDGFVYWQQLKLDNQSKSGKEIHFRPDIGFIFKRKEVYFNVPFTWVFQPRQLGEFEFSFGNRNRTFSSKTIEIINDESPDSIHFNDLNLDYYRHYYLTVQGRREVKNGLLLNAGLDYGLFQPVKNKDREGTVLRSDDGKIDEDLIDLVYRNYKSFTPFFGITWTPGQYYRFDGKKKVYLGSRFPTFSFEYARGIAKALGSNSIYERIEMDVQQKVSLGLLRSVQYYAGMGQFTNTESEYFADFKKFTKHNFPRSWNDPIGGVFHLLDEHWYNASNSYIQAHAMYESPFVLLQLFRNVTQDVLKERLYLSQLYTPALPCYTEFGYGVGNYIFNAGIFVSLFKGRYDSFGVKFAFELGK